ncbi:hypothetical protein K523DRAFT_268597, partial [Schizophyllum commune Tattone D]
MLSQCHYAQRGALSGSLSKAQRLYAPPLLPIPAEEDSNATYTSRLTNDTLYAIRSTYVDVDRKQCDIGQM